MIRILGLFCVLMVVGMMTGCSAPIKETSYEYKFPAWTHDGKILAIKRTIVTWRSGGGYDGTNEYDLVVFNDDGSNERKITTVPSDAGFISCSTSGNYIGYAVDNYIRVIDWAGNVSFNISTGRDSVSQRFDWSPNEKSIVYHNIAPLYVYNTVSATSIYIANNSAYASWKYNNNFVFEKYPMLVFSDKDGNITSTNFNIDNYIYPQYVNDQNKVTFFDNKGKIFFYDINTTLLTSANIGLLNAESYISVNSAVTKITYGKSDKYIHVLNIDGSNNKQIK